MRGGEPVTFALYTHHAQIFLNQECERIKPIDTLELGAAHHRWVLDLQPRLDEITDDVQHIRREIHLCVTATNSTSSGCPLFIKVLMGQSIALKYELIPFAISEVFAESR